MTDAALETRGIGDNLAPPDANPLRDRLTLDHAELTVRLNELLASAAKAPEVIEDIETLKRFATLAKLFQSLIKRAETERVAEKDPYLQGGRIVMAWFAEVIDSAKNTKASIEKRQTEWQRKVAAEERRRRQEEERLAREEADRLAKEAAEREQAVRDAKTLDDAVAAEAAAKQAAAEAEAAAKAAAAKPADLSRTRSDEGAVASLRTWWDFRDLDRDKIDFNANRGHIPMAAIELMARSMIKSGVREAPGMVIFENSRTVNH